MLPVIKELEIVKKRERKSYKHLYIYLSPLKLLVLFEFQALRYIQVKNRFGILVFWEPRPPIIFLPGFPPLCTWCVTMLFTSIDVNIASTIWLNLQITILQFLL